MKSPAGKIPAKIINNEIKVGFYQKIFCRSLYRNYGELDYPAG